MSKRKNSFIDAAKGKGPSPQQIIKDSEQLRTPAYKYARAICERVFKLDDLSEIEDRIYMAEPKSYESISRKARDNYQGDRTKITDGARLTVFTKDAQELENALKIFNPVHYRNHSFHKDMQRRSGYTFHNDPKDFVTNPKRWGYMALYAVMDYDGKSFEVQIYPHSMKKTYNRTHELYEAVRGSLEKWEQSGKAIDEILTAGELDIVKEILELHKQAAQEAGILDLVDRFPEFSDLPSLVKEPNIEQYPQDKGPALTHRNDSPAYTYDA
ncbi:MAG: hypothetical protein ACLFR0_03825 [Alphaproteobacteria bacterium]